MTTNLVTAKKDDDGQIVCGEMLGGSRMHRLVCRKSNRTAMSEGLCKWNKMYETIGFDLI